MRRNLFFVLSAAAWFALAGSALGQTAAGPAAAEKNTQKNAQKKTEKNLVGWWKLDETSGTTAADASKHGRKGTLQDGVSFENVSADGRVGKAAKFDGKRGALEIAGYKGVTGTATRTVAFWIKTSQTRGEIICWGTHGPGKTFRIKFIRGRVGLDPRGGYLYVNDNLADDKWHHVAIVVAEADPPNLRDDVALYADGEPAEIHDIGLLALWGLDTGDEMDVTIGRGFNGLIDEVRLYDRDLSADEIKALFELGEKSK